MDLGELINIKGVQRLPITNDGEDGLASLACLVRFNSDLCYGEALYAFLHE